MGVPHMGAIRIGMGAALTITALVSSGVPASAVSQRDTRGPAAPPILYSRAEPVVYAATVPKFVTRSGATLLLNGRPYRFVGLNIYNANNQGKCWYELGTTAALDQTLTSIGPAQNVFRACSSNRSPRATASVTGAPSMPRLRSLAPMMNA